MLLTGNAHDGKWSENLTISDNLDVDTTFLTRIDFTWVFIDKYDQKTDNLLSDAILEDVNYEDEVKPFSDIMLQKYFKYCKKFKPQLTKVVNENLKKAYLELRKDEQAKENGITLRHLETMIRCTRAIARLHQKEYCTIEDSDKAIELMRKMFEQQSGFAFGALVFHITKDSHSRRTFSFQNIFAALRHAARKKASYFFELVVIEPESSATAMACLDDDSGGLYRAQGIFTRGALHSDRSGFENFAGTRLNSDFAGG